MMNPIAATVVSPPPPIHSAISRITTPSTRSSRVASTMNALVDG